VPFFHDQSRDALRRAWAEAWRRRRDGLPLEPLQAQMADVLDLHPEYARLLDDGDSLARDWTPEHGEQNPFLHLGLHMAIREQVGTDRPAGIADVHAALSRRLGAVHEAEHAMLEKLAEALWEAQRFGRAPDERAYLETLRGLVR
jgi:hypothetical protein